MRLCYNILFLISFWVSAPWYFFKMWRRGNWRAGLGQRFGRYRPEIKAAVSGRPLLWLHAVSVGEVGVCLQLIRSLEPRLAGWQFAVSTTTSTGMGELERRLPAQHLRFYYPTDFPGAVRRAFQTFRPRAIVLVEAEIWPNFLWQAVERDTPLFLVNTRISERSFKGYLRFAFLFRPLFARFQGVGGQSPHDAERLVRLGFPSEAVCVTGNLKFDAAKPDDRPGLDVPALLGQIGVKPDALLFVAGSTHSGEEGILADMLPRLRQKCPNLFLILVPRHFERTKEVTRQLTDRGVKFIRRSDITDQTRLAPGEIECLLVNTTGELKFFYTQASVVFVGKSLTARGGQNPIEPAALGKAMIFGPNMQNFASVARAFLEGRGAVQVESSAELEEALGQLLGDARLRSELGARALKVVQENSGATHRTVDLIMEKLT